MITAIASKVAAGLVIEHHYLHRRPPISHAFGLFSGDQIVGVVTYGVPASRHLQKSACPTNPDLVIELNRLWVNDSEPRNTESFFVSRTLRMMPPRIVVSYADLAQGHEGVVYRAMSWNYAGWTDMERKTPRFDYIPNKTGAHTRESSRSGYGERRRRVAKVKYWTTSGAPLSRRFMARKCSWPKLDWLELPPPKYTPTESS